jgi:N-acetylglucosamine kinase-like BadF-type ATPase
MTPSVVGIDCGGSKSVALLVDGGGTVLGRSEARGANPLVDGEPHLTERMRELMTPLDLVSREPAVVCVGISGAGRERERAMVRHSFSQLGVTAPLRIVHDGEVALAAGSESGVGIAIIAGTGSMAFGRDGHGAVARAGGYGHRLSDEGSAYWLVRRAFQQVLRGVDGRGDVTSLGAALSETLGVDGPDGLLQWFYGATAGRDRVAALLPVVGEAAELGDAVAAGLVVQAGRALAELVCAVNHRLQLGDGARLILSGGAFRGCRGLETSLRESLAASGSDAEGLEVERLEREPVWGAVQLARREMKLRFQTLLSAP